MSTTKERHAIETLNSLMQVDVDAVGAYSRALESVTCKGTIRHLSQFRADHERHIDELSREIRTLGGIPIERKRDLRGWILEGVTMVRGWTGTEGALRAVYATTEFADRAYENALREHMPQGAWDVVKRNRQDEAQHLAYIQRSLAERSWESANAQRHAS